MDAFEFAELGPDRGRSCVLDLLKKDHIGSKGANALKAFGRAEVRVPRQYTHLGSP
jgi:hypothetical protein